MCSDRESMITLMFACIGSAIRLAVRVLCPPAPSPTDVSFKSTPHVTF